MTEGTYLKYRDRRFTDEDTVLIRRCDDIVRRYEAAGMAVTLRQLYYQLVTLNVFANDQRCYDQLKILVRDGRMAGLISWTGIEDRNRALVGRETHDDPESSVKALRESYHTDRWANQPMRPEVWVEKAALSGVIEPVCYRESVDFFACRGYSSHSEQWRAGQRFARYVEKGQRPVVLHLGDHDPSGVNMTAVNERQLSEFAGVPILVVRLALNYDQVERYRPLPNPVKFKDPRAEGYVARYGRSSWELDALSPATLQELVRAAIERYRVPELWREALEREAEHLETLDEVIEKMKES